MEHTSLSLVPLHSARFLSTVLAVAVAVSGVDGYSYVRGPTADPSACPGFYCGRVQMADGNWSTCGACPRGYRAQGLSKCAPCRSEPSFYDAMYLLFMALVSLTLHWRSISEHARRNRATSSGGSSKDTSGTWSLSMCVASQYLSALVEAVLSVIVTLLLLDPVGTLSVRSCPAHSLADWYTLLYNPSPNYDHKLICTQEAVYPLYSGVLLYYAVSLVMLLLVRPWLGGSLGGCFSCRCGCCSRCGNDRGVVSKCRAVNNSRAATIYHSSGPIYSALLFTPALMAAHAVLAGMIHATFAYLTLVVSVASVALLLAHQPDQRPLSLLQIGRHRPRHGLALAAHWTTHAFGVMALNEATTNWYLLVQVLVAMLAPTLFYVMTVKFTSPGLLVASLQPSVSPQQQQQQQQSSSGQSRVRDRVGYMVESP